MEDIIERASNLHVGLGSEEKERVDDMLLRVKKRNGRMG